MFICSTQSLLSRTHADNSTHLIPKQQQMSTPGLVVSALENKTFYQQREQFWQMLQFLFTKYESGPVWTQVPNESFRSLVVQLPSLIESVDEFRELQVKVELLYQLYFVIVTKFRNCNSLHKTLTVSEMLLNENPVVLQSLHKFYHLLVQLKVNNLPLFGHVK